MTKIKKCKLNFYTTKQIAIFFTNSYLYNCTHSHTISHADSLDISHYTCFRCIPFRNHTFPDSHKFHLNIFLCKLVDKFLFRSLQTLHSRDSKSESFDSLWYSERGILRFNLKKKQTRLIERSRKKMEINIAQRTPLLYNKIKKKHSIYIETQCVHLGLNDFLHFRLKFTAANFFNAPEIFSHLNGLSGCFIECLNVAVRQMMMHTHKKKMMRRKLIKCRKLSMNLMKKKKITFPFDCTHDLHSMLTTIRMSKIWKQCRSI
jgi:hypothetical protein